MIRKFIRSDWFLIPVGVALFGVVAGLFVGISGPELLRLAEFALISGICLTIVRALWKHKFFITTLTLVVVPASTVYTRVSDGNWDFFWIAIQVLAVSLFFIAYIDYRLFIHSGPTARGQDEVVVIDLTEPPIETSRLKRTGRRRSRFFWES